MQHAVFFSVSIDCRFSRLCILHTITYVALCCFNGIRHLARTQCTWKWIEIWTVSGLFNKWTWLKSTYNFIGASPSYISAMFLHVRTFYRKLIRSSDLFRLKMWKKRKINLDNQCGENTSIEFIFVADKLINHWSYNLRKKKGSEYYYQNYIVILIKFTAN